jgi:hypothetical protein
MSKPVSLAFLALVGGALSQSANAQAVNPTPAAHTDPLDRVVCRTEDSLGSRLNAKRTCKTVREWKEDAEGGRDTTERMQQSQGTIPSLDAPNDSGRGPQ